MNPWASTSKFSAASRSILYSKSLKGHVLRSGDVRSLTTNATNHSDTPHVEASSTRSIRSKEPLSVRLRRAVAAEPIPAPSSATPRIEVGRGIDLSKWTSRKKSPSKASKRNHSPSLPGKGRIASLSTKAHTEKIPTEHSEEEVKAANEGKDIPLVASDTWAKEPWADTLAALASTSTKEAKAGVENTKSQVAPPRLAPTKEDKAEAEDNANRVVPPHLIQEDIRATGTLADQPNPILADVPPVSKHLPVDTLAHGLDRVLFNPGVHWLQDPRSRVYNFPPYLQSIPDVKSFAFEKLDGFVSSSRDMDLRVLAKRENKQFAGSTSSMSGMLSHIYFLLSEFREVDLSTLSQHFKYKPADFTPSQKMASSVVLNYKDGVYAIDSGSDPLDDADKNILTWQGTLLENFLTKSPKDFAAFVRQESATPKHKTDDESRPRPAFRFAKSKSIVTRSQLDCQDTRLPGTGVFDIKTRACVAIRMDVFNFEEGSGYLIKKQHGLIESFEREYYDLIRSAFLKYSFQVRIGNMDGVMVTYHNTGRIFGFQYIPITEMDERLFGPIDGQGDKVFNKCFTILEDVLEQAAACFPNQTVKCIFETRSPGNVMNVFVQPRDGDNMAKDAPVELLHVQVEHTLNGELSRPNRCMDSEDGEWVINYKIGRSRLPQELIKEELQQAYSRKKRTLVLPANVSIGEAQEWWENIDFSGNKSPEREPVTFDPGAFGLAPRQVQEYRELSRQGRQLSEQLEKKHAGTPKIVLGRPVYVDGLELEHDSSEDEEPADLSPKNEPITT